MSSTHTQAESGLSSELDSRQIIIDPRTGALMGLAYLAMAWFLITFTVTTAPMDSAEQLLWAQDLRLGYGIQPPLYTWLQLACFKILGINMGAVIFLKQVLLGLTGWLTYLSVQRMTQDRVLSILASASLLLLPQIAYESQRNFTHTLLATALAAATLYLFVRIATTPRPVGWLYGWLGLVVGLGALSKYNFLVFILACAAAALCVPELRRVIWNRRMLVSLGLAILMFTPHGWWLIEQLHHDELAGRMAARMNPEQKSSWLASVSSGSLNLAQTTMGFLLPLVLVFVLSYLLTPKVKTQSGSNRDVWTRFLARRFYWEYLLLAALILCFRVTGFKSHWLQPLLFILPAYLLLLLRNHLTPPRVRFVLTVAAACGIITILMLSFRTRLSDYTGHYSRMSMPFEQLATNVQENGFTQGLIVCHDHWIVGNLRLYFRNSVLATPTHEGPASLPGTPMLILWSGDVMPADLKQFVEARWPTAQLHDKLQTITLQYRHTNKEAARYNYMITHVGGE